MDTLSDDELLFYGSIETNFACHSGTVHLSTNESEFDISKDTSTLQSASSTVDDDDDRQLILPELPASIIPINSTIDKLHSIPDIFHYPLIKTKLPSPLKGIVSGIRSALIKAKSSEWYRLKGCGNNTDGFLIQSVSDSNTKFTIRGCAFLHTTYRELLMTNYISHLFSLQKVECANVSIGWFEYKLSNKRIECDVPMVQDIYLNQWSSVPRCCILMKTLGNKRLSDHGLYGIEQLFSLIVANHEQQSHPIDQLKLISLFPSERLTKSEQIEEQLVPFSTWFASISNMLQPIDYHNSKWLHSSSHFSTEIPVDINEYHWQQLWTKHINILNNYLKIHGELVDLLYVIYKRFGFECGSILGLMHHHRISWGTYTDKLGIHCNAHPNNLVIKLSSSTESFLLAPLDFDMSFTERNYQTNEMNINSFDEITRLELSGFQLTLAGDSQTNSGVTGWIEMADYQWTSARWLLRDIMLNEFNSAYNETCQKGCINTFDTLSNEQNCAIQSLIRLALIKTMKEVA